MDSFYNFLIRKKLDGKFWYNYKTANLYLQKKSPVSPMVVEIGLKED
jgi:hypothetical protein